MSNRKITPLKMVQQPFFWRQAVSDSPNRGWSFRNILLYPLMKYKYKFKKHDSFLCDILLIGSNPILNILLLKKIAQQAQTAKKKLTVGILKVSDADYWAYHEFQKPDFLENLSKHFDFEINDGKQFITQLVKKTNWSYIEPVFMDIENLAVQYIKKDSYVNGFVGHLIKKEKNNLLFSNHLSTVNNQENKLKEKLWTNFCQMLLDFVPSYKEIEWQEPVHNTEDKKEKSHILLAKKIFLSSLPSGWLSIKTEPKERYTFFNHDFSQQSVGSALKIANNFHMLELQAMEDIKGVENLLLNLDDLAYS